MDGYLALQLTVLVVHLVFSFIILWVVYRLLKKLFKAIKEPLLGTKNSSLTLFLSFGTALIFFKSTILDSIHKILRFFISPIESIELIRNNFKGTSIDDATLEINIGDFMFAWAEKFDRVFVINILNLNFTGIILFLCTWLFISLIFREIEQGINNAENIDDKLNTMNNNTTIKSIFTLFIVLFSIYLSIASIVAVPEFQNLESTENNTEINTDFEQKLENQKLFSKENLLLTKYKLPKTAENHTELNRTNRRLNKAIDRYNGQVESSWTNDEKTKRIALSRLNAAIDQKIGTKERVKYEVALSDWYLRSHDRWTTSTSYLKNRLVFIKEKFEEIIRKETSTKIDSTVTDSLNSFKKSSETKYKESTEIEYLSNDLTNFYNNLYDRILYQIDEIPQKPHIGEKFGIFNVISGWLLKTESLSLALIVGLFGFGLLGSIGSTFIRSRIRQIKTNEIPKTIIIYDLQGVLINGISAAIVVFLAVKGAIVVFSTDGSNLNPYILFFTCLVASVFSEDVWSWARLKLNQNLAGNNNEKKDPKLPDNTKESKFPKIPDDPKASDITDNNENIT